MDLLLNTILGLSEKDIQNSKIEFNMQAGVRGELFIDRWLRASHEEKENGTCKECSFWGWYGDKRNFLPGQKVFSFIRIRDEEWLFISAGTVLDVPEGTWAKVEIIEKVKPFFGRLIIHCKKGNTYGRYTFNISTFINSAVVKEILPSIYSGEQFNGYDNVHLEFRKLSAVFEGKIMPTYQQALEKITGIYCLTDTKTGKLYIGSATGEGGVAQRWGNYLETKHGGNVKLRQLFNEKGKEYFEEYFTFTLLEYFGLSYDHDKIIQREQYWKKCLNTISNGYNDN